MTSDKPNGDAGPDAARVHDDLMTEYARLADNVDAFDQRLLTMKSWGVTFSLATLALGFQQDHYGLFLVAAAGAFGFWLIEAFTKSHQMRFYPRMGDIEVVAHEIFGLRTAGGIVVSSPLVNWGWHTARRRIWGPSRGDVLALDPQVPQRWEQYNPKPQSKLQMLLWPHIALPHVIVVLLGGVLFVLGLGGVFDPI